MKHQTTFDFELSSHVRADKTQFILVRITKNGKLKRITTEVAVHKDFWNNNKKEVRKSHSRYVELNNKINEIKSQIESFYLEQTTIDNDISVADVLQKAKIKKTDKPKLILAYYQLFLSSHQAKIEKDTMRCWKSRYKKLKQYINNNLKQTDISLLEIDISFGERYYNWFLDNGFGKSHAHRAVGAIKQVLDCAKKDKLISENLLNGIKLEKSKPKPIVYLTEDEIKTLNDCPFYDDRLRRVLDCFILQCFTGMAYNELLHFDYQKHLITDKDGHEWILIKRKKTDENCRIPVLPQAKTVLEKYQNKPPVISNQTMNRFLKEIAVIAQIKNPELLTTHVGRKTAATYLLNNDVPMLVVSKILGHSSVKTTEKTYAFLQDKSIYESVKNLM